MTYKDIFIDRSVPQYIRDEYPMFETFLKAYFEWMEQEKNGIDIVSKLRNYRDVELTLDEFVEYFRKEYASTLPSDVYGDKRLFLKFVREFYKNKGNEASIKLLFRVLFNEDIEFYYPKDDILRASDGKWEQVITVKVLQSDIENITDVFVDKIVGENSKSNALVENVFAYVERDIPIYELNLTNIRGTFPITDVYSVGDVSFNILETLYSIRIDNGGSGYRVGETFTLSDNSSVIATGRIDSVNRGSVQSLELINGGLGYRGEQKIVDNFINLPLSFEWNGINYMERSLGVFDTNDFDLLSQPLSFLISDELVDDEGDIIQITDSPEIVGSGAIGIVNLVSAMGEILEIELLSGGNNYNIPIATVISETGSNAIIDATGGGGTITYVSLDNFPIKTDSTDETIVININTQDGENADLIPVFGGSIIRYRGDWINNDGKLSSTKVLQDNNYYQDFSYDILSSVPKSKWDDIIQRMIHPAGFKKFGSIKHKSLVLNNSTDFVSSSEEYVTRYNLTFNDVNLQATKKLDVSSQTYNITASDVDFTIV